MNRPFLGLSHIHVMTNCFEKATKFYVEVLGFTELKRAELNSKRMVFLSLDDAEVVLTESNDQPICQDGLVNHFGLRVSDIFAAVELLREQGAEFITPEPIAMKGSESYIFFFRGPSGEKIELVQQ